MRSLSAALMGNALFNAKDWTAMDIGESDVADLQRLCIECSDFYELTTGNPPGPSEAHSTFIALPESGADYDAKVLLGIRDNSQRLLAALDAIRDYPSAGTWTIGLLLVTPSHRREGLGSQIIESFARWSNARRFRVSADVVNTSGRLFWEKLAFEITECTRVRDRDYYIMTRDNAAERSRHRGRTAQPNTFS